MIYCVAPLQGAMSCNTLHCSYLEDVSRDLNSRGVPHQAIKGSLDDVAGIKRSAQKLGIPVGIPSPLPLLPTSISKVLFQTYALVSLESLGLSMGYIKACILASQDFEDFLWLGSLLETFYLMRHERQRKGSATERGIASSGISLAEVSGVGLHAA